MSSPSDREPADLSVVIPTFNNETILARTLESWRTLANRFNVEVLVVEDGCRDGTSMLLEQAAKQDWGRVRFRWIHLDDAHELRCTNAGFRAATGALLMAWQDDMFLEARWLVSEIIEVFHRHRDVGLLGLSRGLDMFPVNDPIERWEDLLDWRRLRSTIGAFPWNWLRLQESTNDRPWASGVVPPNGMGLLDDIRSTEWDRGGSGVRTSRRLEGRKLRASWQLLPRWRRHGGPYRMLKAGVLRNGRYLFHEPLGRSSGAAMRRASTRARPLTLERLATTGFRR